MNNKFLRIILLLCLAGIVLSSLLVYQHYRLLGGSEEKSFCAINEWVNCDIVSTSRYSEIFTIPVSGLGLVYYIIIFLYSLFALSSPSPKKSGLFFCFFLSGFALLASIIMAYLSLIKLKALCLFCSGMYVVNLSIFLFFPLVLGIKFRLIPATLAEYTKALLNKPNSLGFKPKTGRNILATVLIFAVGIAVFSQANQVSIRKRGDLEHNSKKIPTVESIINPSDAPMLTQDDILKMHFDQKQYTIDPDNRPVWGNKNARVTVVEFSDFECPFCKTAAEYLKPALKEYEDDVALYFAHYPLDKSCNPNMTRPLHQKSCMAAKAAICAGIQGKFWAYHDLLFRNQKDISEETIIKTAEKLGMDPSFLSTCMASVETTQILKKDVELGRELDVGGTPSVFVNGRRAQAWNNQEIFKAIIEEEISISN